MKHTTICPKCKEVITGVGYQMTSLCVNHIKTKHPLDFKALEAAKERLEEIKGEFDGFWFQHYN